MKLRKITLLESDSNRKGDLFSRLMGDLFYSLGYKEPRYDIHKSGREIDITSTHRTERKIAIAECKAHSTTIGGDDINKFVGALNAERLKKKTSNRKRNEIVGYFISLSGFKETAIEQENEIENARVILLEPQKIVEELIAGKILVSVERAASCVNINNTEFRIANYVDLFAHEKGWVWVLYYFKGQTITHFTFVHAEGNPLIKELSEEVINASLKLNNDLKKLICIYPETANEKSTIDTSVVESKYFEYLENECGAIHFEGLPTDKDAGSVKVKLENIFVPLHLKELASNNFSNSEESESSVRIKIGDVLSVNRKIAILARPGGGKSTLIKRLAIAYAFPERRLLVDDRLPNVSLLPIFIRCRELGDQVQNSITEIINNIPVRAEISHLKNEFQLLISNSLQRGNSLILIDGLDEISDERTRLIFVNQLRTFMSTYPNLYVIITSREAGFRAVSGVISGYCKHYSLSHLEEPEIHELTLKWYNAIDETSSNNVEESHSLAQLIINDYKINAIARNPLLLTTLLFVKRWVGYLPTKTNILYQEMIKLLLVTWNVEGHEQLDIDEAEPQLAYVAFWMMQNGKQTISSKELKSCLFAARKQMPDILDYTKVSVSDFIRRVESRSSLLIMSGHQQDEDGVLPIYEFLHLSFQEYLTAKAIAEKYLPESEDEKSFIDILEPYFLQQNWREVIPLVAVLTKRQSKSIIDYLINKTKGIVEVVHDYTNVRDSNAVVRNSAKFSRLLGSCLAYEIQISPEVLDIAIEWYVKSVNDPEESETVNIIANSKFGDIFKNKIRYLFFKEFGNGYTNRLAVLMSRLSMSIYEGLESNETIKLLITNIQSDDYESRCIAVLCLMQFSYGLTKDDFELPNSFSSEEVIKLLIDLTKINNTYFPYSVCWAIAWANPSNLIKYDVKSNQQLVETLVEIWLFSEYPITSRFAAWALCEISRPTSDIKNIKTKNIYLRDLINNKYTNPVNEHDQLAAIYIGINFGIAWDNAEIAPIIRNYDTARQDENYSAIFYAKYLGINLEDDDHNPFEEGTTDQDDFLHEDNNL